jgi:hypothetical protein
MVLSISASDYKRLERMLGKHHAGPLGSNVTQMSSWGNRVANAATKPRERE